LETEELTEEEEDIESTPNTSEVYFFFLSFLVYGIIGETLFS